MQNEMASDSEPKKGHTFIQWMIALAANVTLFTYGLQTGWISPMMRVLQSADSPTGTPLTDNEISWLASSVSVAAMAGVPIFTYLVDVYGRRIGLIAISIIQAKATATIAFLRGLKIEDEAVVNEVKELRNDVQYYKTLPDISYRSIFTVPAWRRTFLILMTLMAVRSLNGALPIITYASNVLSLAGVTFNPELQTLSFPVFMILGSIISMNCVEKIGRKPVIVACLLATSLSMVILSTALILRINGFAIPSWLPVFCIIIIVTAFAGGVSPIPYILMAEMFNFQIRVKAVGVAVIFSWFLNFLQLLAFSPISNTLGIHNTFYIFAGANLIGFFASVIFLPETKAKTVEQIENIMSGNPAS